MTSPSGVSSFVVMVTRMSPVEGIVTTSPFVEVVLVSSTVVSDQLGLYVLSNDESSPGSLGSPPMHIFSALSLRMLLHQSLL